MLKGGPNLFLLELDKKLNNTILSKGGMEFFIYTEIKKEWNLRTWGKVAALPCKLNDRPTMADPFPWEGETVPYSKLDLDIEVGETVHFRYRNNIEEMFLLVDGVYYLAVPADEIFAVERDGELIPVGGKMLVDRIEEKKFKSDLLIIPDKFDVERPEFKARVYREGKPLKGDNPTGTQLGDTVWLEHMPEDQDFGQGRKYSVIYQRDVLAYEKA